MVNVLKLRIFLLTSFLLLSVGCKDSEQEAYDNAYKANYDKAYQVGLRAGEDRGNKEGQERGTSAAYLAAETGLDWRLYSTLGLSALAVGFFAGLFMQYTILLICRRSERLPQLWTVAFVPAMKRSYSYAIFQRRSRLMVEIDEEIRDIGARTKLHIAQIHAVRDAVAQKLKAISSVEELSTARLLELAREEFSKIVSASNENSNQIKNSQSLAEGRPLITYSCPSCQKLLRYKEQIANKTVNCPSKECGRPIKLPPLILDSDDAPLVIDINDE